MRSLKKALEIVLPPFLRRFLSLIYKDIQAVFMRLPGIGKMLWRRRFLKLYEKPERLLIEITSICNAKCIMCPRHNMDRRMEVMDEKMYKHLIDQAAEMKIDKFALNGYGEIFTARNHYQKYINYLLEKIPHAKININTNGSLMREEEAQFLIDKKIDSVHIDIDGATKETFEFVREHLKFEDVVNNTKRLIEMRNTQGKVYPKVRVGMIIQKENEHEYQKHQEMWKGVADYTAADYMVSRLGSVEKFKKERIISTPCSLPFYELNIMTDGNAVMCCDDWNVEESMGNVKRMSLKEIWQGEKFRRVRALHQAGRANEIKTCAKCDWFRAGEPWFRIYREILESDLPQSKNKSTAKAS